MQNIDIFDSCPLCGSPVKETTIPEHIVTWGSPDMEHGEHTFVIRDIQSHECAECGEGFQNSVQLQDYSNKLNECIKEKLGFDWLSYNRNRRRLTRRK